MTKEIKIKDFTIGGGSPLVLIAGPCVIESEELVLKLAADLKALTGRIGMKFIFKSSYDKANRTSLNSFRGPGLTRGLEVLQTVKSQVDVPVLTDVHNVDEVGPAAEVVDVLQIPAFLCRQTDLLVAAAKTGRVINVKKGQFLAPWDMKAVVEKFEMSGNKQLLLTDRGTSFGYNYLVSDFRSLHVMRELGYPVVFDATHSVQQPGGMGHASGGKREFIPLLSRCGVAAGCDAIFMEVHYEPDKALSDGPNMWPFDRLESLLTQLMEIDAVIRKTGGGAC